MAKRVTEKKSERAKQKGGPQKKKNIFSRMGSFFSRLGKELKKVSWPDREKTKRLSTITFAIIITVIILIFATDAIMTGLLKVTGFERTPVATAGAVETPISETAANGSVAVSEVPSSSESASASEAAETTTVGSSAAETTAAETTAK